MVKLNRLTLITKSYNCDKGCPFCIAKSNKKFSADDDELQKTDKILNCLNKNQIKFKRFVFSGNGEPSTYNFEDIATVAFAIKKHILMFDGVRVQTSGNLFYEKQKLELLEELIDEKLEIMPLRISLDSEKDMEVLGYCNDYLKANSFKTARKIMLDVALTKHLEIDQFTSKLESFIEHHPNVLTIRFKTLLTGNNMRTPQARWVTENTMSRDEIIQFIDVLSNKYKGQGDNLIVNNTELLFEKSGAYNRDVVISGGKMMDYDSKILTANSIVNMSKQIGKSDNEL